MRNEQTSSGGAGDALWRVQDRQPLQLTVAPGGRRVLVTAGRLWLTVDGEHGEPAQDHWLDAGQALSLPGGRHVLMDGWPRAEFELLVPPCSGRSWLAGRLLRALAGGGRAGLGGLGARGA